MVTFEVFTNIASSIHTCLNFTYDIPQFHSNYKVPMLDIQVWDEHCSCGTKIIRHQFYEKETSSNKVIDFKSAMPLRMKITTLSQEIIRINKNTGRDAEIETTIETIKNFTTKMKISNYPKAIIN